MSLWCTEIKYNKKGASDEIDEEIKKTLNEFLAKYRDYIEVIHIYKEG